MREASSYPASEIGISHTSNINDLTLKILCYIHCYRHCYRDQGRGIERGIGTFPSAFHSDGIPPSTCPPRHRRQWLRVVLVSEIEPPGPWRLAQVMNRHEHRSSERVAFFAGRALDAFWEPRRHPHSQGTQKAFLGASNRLPRQSFRTAQKPFLRAPASRARIRYISKIVIGAPRYI